MLDTDCCSTKLLILCIRKWLQSRQPPMQKPHSSHTHTATHRSQRPSWTCEINFIYILWRCVMLRFFFFLSFFFSLRKCKKKIFAKAIGVSSPTRRLYLFLYAVHLCCRRVLFPYIFNIHIYTSFLHIYIDIAGS